MKRPVLLSVLVAILLVVGVAAKPPQLVDRWAEPGFQPREFKKILVIGISDDREARHRFEDLFVSHLRGSYIQGVTSYSIVPDLTAAEDSEAIVKTITEQEIDAAISVRVVSLKGVKEEDWQAAWQKEIDDRVRLREVIDESLPVPENRAKKNGVEVALWETQEWARIWAARTEPLTKSQMKKTVPTFVQTVMSALKQSRLLSEIQSPD